MIVFTSDHGEMLGDCGLWEKFVPHQASIGIPLIMAGPGRCAGTGCRTAHLPRPARDLIDLAGAEPIAGIDSRSMVGALADPSRPHREVVFSGLGHWRIAFDGGFKLMAGCDPATPRAEMEAARFDPAAIARRGWSRPG